MLTSKQRAYLRGLASVTESIIQIGKGGISENLIKTTSDALEARELVKLSVLKNSELTPEEAACQLADATCAEVVTVIGNKIVLYRESNHKKRIEL